MTRKQAQEWLLHHINEKIEQYGEHEIAVACPKRGKNSWTYNEFKHAVENDICLEGSTMNPIDDSIKYFDYIQKSEPSCFRNKE